METRVTQKGKKIMSGRKKKLFRHGLSWVVTLVILGLLAPGGGLMPPSLLAESNADTDAEIVYLDNTGTIRVLDTQQAGNQPKVDWVSPTAGWERFVLGDVDNDGDQEIIAIKETSGQGTLAVWDPVVAACNFDQKTPNGIPWAKLYETTFAGNPQAVGAGKLDPNLPGDHIVYVYDRNADQQRLVVLKPTTATPTGREWATHFTRDFNEDWKTIAVGNVDNTGADEIVMIDSAQGRLSVYRADSQSGALLHRNGSTRPYRATITAQYDGEKGKEVIALREGEGLASFFVLEYDNGDFEEPVAEAFTPSPRAAFAADINNDRREEIVLLRHAATSNAIRMIVRGNDQAKIPVELEQSLDQDNGYTAGDGGDVDGDGKDEIVIMRDNNIRVYTQPDQNAAFSDYRVATDRSNLQIGNVDRNGFVICPQFGASLSAIAEEVTIGATGTARFMELRNLATSDPLPFKIEIENRPSWLEISPTVGNTPIVLTYRANAVGLAAGDYTTRLKITSDNQRVANQPFYIPVTLKATPALIDPKPAALAFPYLAGQQPVTLTQSLSIFGTEGVKFTALVAALPAVQSAAAPLTGAIHSGYVADDGRIIVQDALGNAAILALPSDAERAVPWLSLTPTEGIIPAVLTLTVSPGHQTNALEQAFLVVIGDSRTGKPPQNVRLVTITALRATAQQFMPLGFNHGR